jgi:hypothetical protein
MDKKQPLRSKGGVKSINRIKVKFWIKVLE